MQALVLCIGLNGGVTFFFLKFIVVLVWLAGDGDKMSDSLPPRGRGKVCIYCMLPNPAYDSTVRFVVVVVK
ncbi:hypothetical protein H5410_059526 [Solanum commersonii]|uniref:Uncharacterized protein n=1 Tax=Solanum commersonii TaxID=4109 RepID=A0A9J5W368_SOLCO|nr:hypothetical protein H5410_059526 [Solanum commersonii]